MVITWSPQGQVTEFSTVNVTVSSGPPTETIPSLTGSTCAGATTALTAVGLVAQCTNAYSTSIPNGQVISWTPTGTALEGTTIAISISEGPPPVTVPDVSGDSVNQASNQLTNAGLVPGNLQGSLSGRVFQTNPPAGASVPQGTTVTLYTK
jgi:serine/threonine-protein kinase